LKGEKMPTPKTTYAVRRAFPASSPTVLVVFKGLLTFCFAGNLNCEVGINNQVPDTQKHLLNIKVWRKAPDCPPSPMVDEDISPPRGIDIEVHHPAELDGVYVYEPDPFRPLDRIGTSSDPQDFRWMLDFEGPDLYDVHLEKVTASVRPSLNVNNGLFYTRQKSESKFVLHSPSGNAFIGSVCKLLAANIYLAVGGDVEIKVDGSRLAKLDHAANVTYQVDFVYDCFPVTGHCDFDPDSNVKEMRNDFYLNHRAFTLPNGVAEKELICVQKGVSVRDPQLCGDISKGPEETTDPAPCTGTGFGQSGGHGG
jgi:hypothetical protein